MNRKRKPGSSDRPEFCGKLDSSMLSIRSPHTSDHFTLREARSLQETRAGRILAIDLGERRMGLALSDPFGLTAKGLPTAQRRNKRQDLNFLEVLTRRHGVSRVLVGNPLNMDGSAGPQSAQARAFAEELTRRLNIAVELRDERLTSVEAHQVLAETGADPQDRRGSVDRVAAALLLQGFLDAHRVETAAEETGP